MTNEVKEVKIEELLENANEEMECLETLVETWYECIYMRKPFEDEEGETHQLDLNERVALDESIHESISVLNELKETIKYKELSLMADPLMEAVLNAEYPKYSLKVVTPDKELKQKFYYEIKEGSAVVNLVNLQKYCKKAKKEIGHNKDWPKMLDNLNYQVYAHVAMMVGVNPESINDFKMKQTARKIKENKGEPYFLMNFLDEIIKAMVGDQYGATATTYNLLTMTYLSKDRRTVKDFKAMKNGKQLAEVMLSILNTTVTGESINILIPRPKN